MKQSKRRHEKEWVVISCKCLVNLLLISASFIAVNAQAMPSLLGDGYNSSTYYKNDFCDHHSLYRNAGRLEWPTALQGHNISVMAVPSQYFRVDEKSGAINSTYPGLIPEVLDELAKRGKFQWRNSFGFLEKPDDMEFQQLLDWTVNAYDIGVNDWILSVERLKTGFSFAELFDASPILITIKPEHKATINLWNWCLPFDEPVWWCILGTILASALVYLFLQAIDGGHYYTNQPMKRLVSENIYLSTLMFTQNMMYRPSTNAMKIFVTSFSVWSLFVTSAYTANLASFLVIRNTPDIEIKSIDDTIQQNLPVCVWDSTVIDKYVTDNFPDARLVRKPRKNDLYQGLRNGECAVAVISKHYWEFDEVNKETNGDCKLIWVGRAVTHMSAGFATKTDYGQLCTTLLSDVFDMHIKAMKDEGIIDKLTKKALRYSKDSTCTGQIDGNADNNPATDGENAALDMHSMAGTFALHAIFTTIAIVVAIMAPKVEKSVKKTVDRASIRLAPIVQKASFRMAPNLSKKLSKMGSKRSPLSSSVTDEDCAQPPRNQHKFNMSLHRIKESNDGENSNEMNLSPVETLHDIRSDLKNFIALNSEKIREDLMETNAEQDKQIAEVRAQVAKIYDILMNNQVEIT